MLWKHTPGAPNLVEKEVRESFQGEVTLARDGQKELLRQTGGEVVPESK